MGKCSHVLEERFASIFRMTGFFQVDVLVIRRKEMKRFLPQHQTIQLTLKVGEILTSETLEHLPSTRHNTPPPPKANFKSKLPPLSYLTAYMPVCLTN
jgi:hypothetical protein